MLTQCPRCDYLLEGLPDIHVCPECGYAYDKRSEVIVQGRGIAYVLWCVIVPAMFGVRGLKLFVGHVAEWLSLMLLPVWIAWGWHLVTRRRNRVVLTPRGIELIDTHLQIQARDWTEIAEVRYNSGGGGVRLLRPDGSKLADIEPQFLAAYRLDQQLVRDAERWRREHGVATENPQ
jgi:hypothetical protein